jgi:hypothetical protein
MISCLSSIVVHVEALEDLRLGQWNSNIWVADK